MERKVAGDKREVEREIRLKEEEEESNPCTGLANPHRTTTIQKAVYLLLFLPNSRILLAAHNLKSFQSTKVTVRTQPASLYQTSRHKSDKHYELLLLSSACLSAKKSVCSNKMPISWTCFKSRGIKHQICLVNATKAQRGSRGMATFILNFTKIWQWSVLGCG
jgi:hypothetical protein